ncbi:MFS transporter, partial [Caballeronia sp. GAFFF3]|uniref:MFS transporter n=1 Tax=Caballeronia sp. GAFFF3 TaxID=2921759 RepID=UPI002027BA64
GISTMGVGLLPTYQQVGIWAPVLLVSLRLVQGFAVAGELSGASSMILEHAPFGRRAYFTSFTIQGSQAGQLMAFGVFLPLAHFMPKEHFVSWGWRIPFLFSVVVIIVGYIIRRQVRETPTFAQERAHGQVPGSPVAEVLRQNWGDVLRVVCMALTAVVVFLATVFGT